MWKAVRNKSGKEAEAEQEWMEGVVGNNIICQKSRAGNGQEGKVDRNSLASFRSTDKSSERGVMGIASSWSKGHEKDGRSSRRGRETCE